MFQSNFLCNSIHYDPLFDKFDNTSAIFEFDGMAGFIVD